MNPALLFYPSSHLHLLYTHIIPPSFHLCSSLCVNASVAGKCWYLLMFTVCVCVDMCRMINLCFAGGRESRCMWLFCTARWVFFVLFFGGCVLFDTVSNPASPLVGLQECCEHSGLPLPLRCFLCVSTEDLPSCPRVTVCLTSSLSLCYAVLAESLLSLSHRIV